MKAEAQACSHAGDVSQVEYFIADDHPSVTIAVRHMLSHSLGLPAHHFVSVTTSADLLEVCSVPASGKRVVVLDLVMPGGLKRVGLVKALRARDASASIVVYTAEESAFLAQAVIAAGANAYVAKTSPAAELMAAVDETLAGRSYIDSGIDMKAIQSHPWSTLTESERSVLLAMCRGAKAQEISASTGRHYSTVTTHKQNGLTKLDLRDANDLLPYIYENGLLHEIDA